MVIKSTRLGKLDVPKDLIIKFPMGLLGFNDEVLFALVPQGENSPFAFLQSASDPDLTFFVVEPFTFFSDYEFELNEEYQQELELVDSSQVKIYNIVTIKDKVEEMTANLLAPVIVNMETKTARQVVLEKVTYSTRHRIFPQGLSHSADGGDK
ncbi:MAG: fliW [Firmicutes bacterium]|nr:fliW [Bacillota bacterium]